MATPVLPDRARVVVIGGGVIGSSVAYHLAHMGWKDVVLLERDRLTSGTTWHAAGLVVTFGSTSETSTELRKYTRDLYRRLEAETGQATGFNPVGFIEVAADADRLEEYRRVAAFNRWCGVDGLGPERSGSGAKVVLGARRTDRIDALVKDITAKGGAALGFQADVTKRSEVEALVQGAIHEHGRIDVIVNDAGIMPIAPMAAIKVEEWDRMIDVNIKGLLFGVAAVLPIMQKQKQGHIINMSSVGGFKVWAPGGTVYSATKFAVRAITEGLRMEHKADNIRCTIISPGAVATELPEGSSEEDTRKNLREFYKIAVPADSVARAIVYAIEQPAEVDVNEIVIRPTKQDF